MHVNSHFGIIFFKSMTVSKNILVTNNTSVSLFTIMQVAMTDSSKILKYLVIK